jgi:anti-sigma B factor antagonist
MEANPIVLDDSPGDLGALLDARRRALEAEQGFVVCVGETVEPGVQRILDITGLVPVLPVLRARDEAIAAARNGAEG